MAPTTQTPLTDTLLPDPARCRSMVGGYQPPAQPLLETRVVVLAAAHRNHPERVRQQPVAQQVQQRREQVALCQVAGGAEQEQGVVHRCRDWGFRTVPSDRTGAARLVAGPPLCSNPPPQATIPASMLTALPARPREYTTPKDNSTRLASGGAHR